MVNVTLEQGYSFGTMLVVAIGAIALVAVFYYRAFGKLRAIQWQTLLFLRALAILLIVLLLFRPVFSYQKELEEKRALIFLIDRSQSMSIADNAALKAAHAALYKWTKDDHEAGRVTGEHPVSAALANFKKGEEWILHLSSYSRDGDRRYIASFFCPDTDFAPRIKGKRGCTSIVETREFILLKISILMWPDA